MHEVYIDLSELEIIAMGKRKKKKPTQKSVQKQPIRLWGYLRTVAIVLLLTFAFWSRFYRLGDKPLHHDESLFAYYSLNLSQTGKYIYIPMLHGPFMLDVNALVYILLGDSDFTLRFATACLGMGILFLLFAYRNRLGTVGFLATLVLVVISPTLMYYSRFFRHDIPLAFFCLLALWFYIKFFTEGKGWALLWGTVCTMMLICIKENSLIFLFTIATFAVLLFVVDLLKGLHAKRIGWKALKEAYRLSLHSNFLWILLVNLILWAVVFIFYNGIFEQVFHELFSTKAFFSLSAPWWHYAVVLIAFLISYFILTLLHTWTHERYGEDALLSRVYKAVLHNKIYLLVGIIIALLAYLLIFTTFLTNPKGLFQIYRDTFAYWWGQHKEHRIYGPYHYYLPILGIYELPALLLVLGGGLWALLRSKWGRWGLVPGWVGLSVLTLILYHALNIKFDADKWDKGLFHVSSPLHIYIIISLVVFGGVLTWMYLWRKERFTALLVYWTIASFLIYSWAGEKVPWVSVHIVLPMLLLAGVYVQKFVQTKAYQKIPYVWHVLAIIFVFWIWDKSLFHVSSPLHIYIIISLVVLCGVLTWMYLWRKHRFTALLVYWTTASFLIYSWAGEKVPWVSVLIVLPMLLLAGVYIQKFIQTKAYQKFPYVWHVLAIIFVFWTLRSALILCLVNSANTAERLIYGHTTQEVKYVVEEIDRLAELLGTGKDTRIVVRGQIIWPMGWWYMRHYKHWTEHEDVNRTTHPILVINWDEASRTPNVKENYNCTRYKVRTWWQPKFMDVGRMLAIWKIIIPKHRVEGSTGAQDIRDSKDEWNKLINYLLYRKHFEHYAAPYPSMSSVDFAFCVRKGIIEQQ